MWPPCMALGKAQILSQDLLYTCSGIYLGGACTKGRNQRGCDAWNACG